MKFLSILLGTATSAFMLTSESSALAQQAPQPQPPANTTEDYVMEVDEEEIRNFANAFSVVQDIQRESREKMAQAIEQEGLTIKEYNELYRGQTTVENSDPSTSNVSEEKRQQFENADARIDEIEQEAQAAIEQAITDEGLAVERFQQIGMAVRRNPDLQEQVKNILEN
ncbi:hypothetical protein PCC7418_0630 [Halothece sp. PCC 7418]|uniref:DUF4168 domain-containing protein n=1 Tax=Halothece sp. (strain PCC 7418) TaxID=65093 RepID=UPI0002A07DFE|nr:DUF4168 domain-containing protein [Halothece sp. PCC 7418]AFZ42855.1 hypothetical protein PCC7418_0630 [Halothece sp. PCC 7418]